MGIVQSFATRASPKDPSIRACNSDELRSREAEYSSLVDFFTKAALDHEHLPDRVTSGWEYFVDNELWNTKFPTLCAFEEDFAHTADLKRIVENSANRSRKRTNQALDRLESKWGAMQESPLDDLLPPKISYHMSRSLSKLAEALPHDQAVDRLQEAVDDRRGRPKKRGKQHSHLTRSDVDAVLEELAPLPTRSSPAFTAPAFTIDVPSPLTITPKDPCAVAQQQSV
jgi:hypothetical protein